MSWQLPDSVVVLGKTYRVVPRARDGSCAFGSTDMALGVIELAEHLCQDEAAETLLHEVLHVLDYSLGLELEEQAIGRLSVGLYATLVANPELVGQ